MKSSAILNLGAPRHLNRLQTDEVKEYFNATFTTLMNRHNIQHFASESNHKAAVVKRFPVQLEIAFGHTSKTARQFSKLSFSKSSWTRTLIHTTSQLRWRWRTYKTPRKHSLDTSLWRH